MYRRGAQSNPHNRFFAQRYEDTDDARMPWDIDEEEHKKRTKFIEVFPKNILSENDSPDLGFRVVKR